MHWNHSMYLPFFLSCNMNKAEKFSLKIPCDFKQSSDCTYLDNSAAVCAVCGMIELYKIKLIHSGERVCTIYFPLNRQHHPLEIAFKHSKLSLNFKNTPFALFFSINKTVIVI